MNELLEVLRLSLLIYGAPVLGLAVLAGSLGFPVPSSLLIIAAGAISRHGGLEWYYAAILVFFGAILGDSLSFAMGRWGGEWLSRRYEKSIAWTKAQSTFDRGSGWAVFLTRFLIPALAIPVNFMAGASCRYRVFLVYAIAGEATWILLYGGAGYLFSSQLELIQYIVTNIGSIALMSLAFGAGYLIWRKRKYFQWTWKVQPVWLPLRRDK